MKDQQLLTSLRELSKEINPNPDWQKTAKFNLLKTLPGLPQNLNPSQEIIKSMQTNGFNLVAGPAVVATIVLTAVVGKQIISNRQTPVQSLPNEIPLVELSPSPVVTEQEFTLPVDQTGEVKGVASSSANIQEVTASPDREKSNNGLHVGQVEEDPAAVRSAKKNN